MHDKSNNCARKYLHNSGRQMEQIVVFYPVTRDEKIYSDKQ